MGNCCTTSNSKEEIINELKKETKPSEYETKGSDNINHFITANQSILNEQIIFEVKDNPLEDFSKAIFQKLNEMRSNPIIFYNKSSRYYLNEFISKAVSHKPKPQELTWSTKKARRISEYFQSKANRKKSSHQKIMEINELFEQDYNVYGHFSNGSVTSIDNIIWKLLSTSNAIDRNRIFFNNYSYCVIYSDVFMNEEVLSFLFFFIDK